MVLDATESKFNRTPNKSILQIRKGNTAFMEIPILFRYSRKIYWAGGESLIMDEHWYIMNKLVEMGRTKKIIMRIFYNTNFSKLVYKEQDAQSYGKTLMRLV